MGSKTTMRNVQIGPKNKDPNPHPKPLLPFAWARPALISARVNQPAANSPFMVETPLAYQIG